MDERRPPRTREEALAQADAELNALRRERRRAQFWFGDDHPLEVVLLWFVTTFSARRILLTVLIGLAISLLAMESCK